MKGEKIKSECRVSSRNWWSVARTFQPEPKWNYLPNFLSLPRCPRLQGFCTGFALRELRALELPQLFGDIKWVITSPFPIEEVVLCGEINELGKVLATRSCRYTDATRGRLAEVGVSHGVLLRVANILPTSHTLDQCGDCMLARFLPQTKSLQVERA